MSELVPYQQSKYGDDNTFNEIATSAGFLPRLQLFGSNSDAVKRGTFPMAHYGLVVQKDQIDDLGKEVDILPITWRPKAMRIGDTVVSYFNPKTEEFMKVQADSEQPDSGCMFGQQGPSKW